MCDHRLFGPQDHALSDAGYHCCHLGEYSGLSLEALASQILKRAPRRFAAVGLSMGGLIAMELYKQAPDRISHLALLNTTAREDAAKDARKAQLRRVAAGQLDLVLRDELKPQYLHPANRTSERLQVLEEMGCSLGEHVFCSQTLALASRGSYLPLLNKIACPTLVVAGEDDTVCPVDRHKEIAARIPHSDFRILKTCGHVSTLERPDEVNRALIDLLDQPGARLTKTGTANLRLV